MATITNDSGEALIKAGNALIALSAPLGRMPSIGGQARAAMRQRDGAAMRSTAADYRAVREAILSEDVPEIVRGVGVRATRLAGAILALADSLESLAESFTESGVDAVGTAAEEAGRQVDALQRSLGKVGREMEIRRRRMGR